MEQLSQPSTLTPSLQGLYLLPPPQLPPGPRPTDEVDLSFLGAASLQLPQLLVHQALDGGHVQLALQQPRQVSQQVLPRTQRWVKAGHPAGAQ